jgi:hypothetical protein
MEDVKKSEFERTERVKSCPFCCVKIPAQAQKCQYCGEWVARKKSRGVPSDTARAVNRGLKQKEIDDWWLSGCYPKVIAFFMIVAYSITDSLKISLTVLVVLALLGGIAYWRE